MRAVVSVGFSGWYPRGVARLVRSLAEHGLGKPGKVFAWSDTMPPDTPADNYALSRGCRSVMWLDASAWALQSLGPIFDVIERDGYYFVADACSYVRGWCGDATMDYFGLEPDDLDTIPMLQACIIGLDFRFEIAQAFYAERRRAADVGAFGYPGNPSRDTCFKAQRSQVSASIIAHRLGMKLTTRVAAPLVWPPWGEIETRHILAFQGM
jgi:hypothetical protein